MSHARTIAAAVAKQLKGNGYIGVFAGGCVRDRFLGVEPKDFDVATNATPNQIKRIFENDNCLFVGEAFGVIIVIREGVQVEVATLRNDGLQGDGRRPDSVVFITESNPLVALKGDAARRDLTINAMFEDPETGEVFDFFGGQDDLRKRIIRSVGDPSQRFTEDRLRMMRVVRFASKLGFTVDRKLMAALKKHSSDLQPGVIVSWERIAVEMMGILTSKAPVVGLKLMLKTGLMKQVLPELLELKGFRGFQDPFWHPERFALTHTLMVVNVAATEEAMAPVLARFADDEFIIDGIRTSLSSFALRLALLVHDIAKARTQSWGVTKRTRGWLRFILPYRVRVSNQGHAEQGAVMAEAICRRFKLSADITSRVKEIVLMHMQMHHFDNPEIKRTKLTRLMQRADVFDLIVMQHCDSLGTGRRKADRESASLMGFYLDTMAEMRNDPVMSRRPDAECLMTGKHIIAAGFKAGPIVGVVKDAVLEAQHAGEFTDMEGALAWLGAHIARFQAIDVSTLSKPKLATGSKHCC
ncbi:MAG: CCA tRNA nucleotidyltransferase [Candidatus Melainabacteria bacterium]|nr:CCA tRNA nucleotidyltransferase [Candidatus Melainabacteria bacterium]